jgi:hypothetical protein
MTPEQKQIVREAEIENSWFHFYTKFRSQLQDCQANDNLLNEELESRLLPISFENLETVWTSLSPEQKARYAKPTGVVKPHKKPEAPVAVKVDEILDKAGELPSIYTRHKILVELNASEYRALRKQYGDQAVENRVNGTE